MLCKIMDCYWANFILRKSSAMEQHATLLSHLVQIHST